nr:hypothetical protein [Rhizobium lentis]
MDVHYCEQEGCEDWGSWGNFLSPSAATRWWCFEHFPHKTDAQEQALRRKLNVASAGDIL